MKSLLLLIILLSFAQEPALKNPTQTRGAETPTTLALEVKYNADLPPAYISVRGAETKPRWIWVTRFARVPGVEATDLPIQAVRVQSQFNGETADIKVTLLRGNHGFEREDAVGTYKLGLNEQIAVNDLRSVGIAPISLTLIETVPPLPPSPGFENRTAAVEIANVISTNVPLPAYKLTLRNVSEKSVRAVKLDVISDGRPRLVTFMQGEFDKPLIEVGGVVERLLQVVIPQKAANAYAPGIATESTIRIHTVVFDDLTFEGEEAEACRYEAFVAGRRLWLKRVLPLLDQELNNPTLSPTEFKQKFSALTYELKEHEKTKKSAVSTACGNPDSLVNVATENLKLQMLRDLNEIITTRPAPPVNFRVWLETRRNDYRGWLARLK